MGTSFEIFIGIGVDVRVDVGGTGDVLLGKGFDVTVSSGVVEIFVIAGATL
jgi:hypothetical protein